MKLETLVEGQLSSRSLFKATIESSGFTSFFYATHFGDRNKSVISKNSK